MRKCLTCGKCGAEKVAITSGELVCRPCANLRNQAYKQRHAQRVAASRAVYREENRESLREKNRQYREQNPGKDAAYYQNNKEQVKASVSNYRNVNREVIAEKLRARRKSDPDFVAAGNERLKAWKKRNPDKVNAQTAKRYAHKLRALPSWADLKDIADIYALARLRTELTGIEWHVDHTVPLNSPLVCGLHCEANLQIIPAGPNISKGNNWWPDMPDAPTHAATFSDKPSLYLHYSV
ncbi:hypothetical protein ACOTC5_30260 [Achromobacter xylosoxidans]